MSDGANVSDVVPRTLGDWGTPSQMSSGKKNSCEQWNDLQKYRGRDNEEIYQEHDNYSLAGKDSPTDLTSYLGGFSRTGVASVGSFGKKFV